MVNRPSTPEIITVNSEALQTQIRDLLPSQSGFGSELQASNVITPIIDLTAAAEGSGLPSNLQRAAAFGSNTAFSASGATVVLANSPGFYEITGVYSAKTSGLYQMSIRMSDGIGTKDIWEIGVPATTTTVGYLSGVFTLTVFLRAGDSVSAVSGTANGILSGSHRQIATGDGTLVQPVGFPL